MKLVYHAVSVWNVNHVGLVEVIDSCRCWTRDHLTWQKHFFLSIKLQESTDHLRRADGGRRRGVTVPRGLGHGDRSCRAGLAAHIVDMRGNFFRR